MKKIVSRIIAMMGLSLFLLLCSSCDSNRNNQKNSDVIRFATSGDYPPFEYYSRGDLTGFDIELARLIAKELKKEPIFSNMQFNAILPSLQHGQVDIAISSISETSERKKNFDFSDVYYQDHLAAVYHRRLPVTQAHQLQDKKIACQLGTTMDLWLKKHMPHASVMRVDQNNQAIESLKSGHIDVVVMDGAQAKSFSKQSAMLNYAFIAQSDEGYALAFKKQSPLLPQVNQALKNLQRSGKIDALKRKWFHDF